MIMNKSDKDYGIQNINSKSKVISESIFENTNMSFSTSNDHSNISLNKTYNDHN